MHLEQDAPTLLSLDLTGLTLPNVLTTDPPSQTLLLNPKGQLEFFKTSHMLSVKIFCLGPISKGVTTIT